MTFWAGFQKKAMEMLKWNALGGVEPTDEETIARAQQAELKTLAEDVEGANCGNCRYSRPLPDETSLCNHPDVMMEVTPRMICAYWEHPGSIYAGSGEDKAKQLQQEQEMAANGEGEQMAQMDQAGQEMGLEQPGEAGGQAMPAGGGGQAMPAAGGAIPSDPSNPGGNQQPPAEAGNGQDPGGKAPAPGGDTPQPKKKPEKKKSEKKDDKGGANTININVGKEKKASALRGFLSE